MPETTWGDQNVPETTVGDGVTPETPLRDLTIAEAPAADARSTTSAADEVAASGTGPDDRALLSLIGDAVLAVDGVARLEPTLKSLFLARVPGSARTADSPDGIELTSLGAITDVAVDIAATDQHPSREVAESVQHVVGQLLQTHGREPGRIKVTVLTIEHRP